MNTDLNGLQFLIAFVYFYFAKISALILVSVIELKRFLPISISFLTHHNVPIIVGQKTNVVFVAINIAVINQWLAEDKKNHQSAKEEMVTASSVQWR